jgi:hypothetical protein
MNGGKEPSEGPKVMYRNLSLEKRLSYLSQLLQQNNLRDYNELLRNDSDLEKLDEFQKVLKPF